MISGDEANSRRIALAALLFMMSPLGLPTQAQSLSKLTVGEDASRLTLLDGNPVAADTYKSFTVRKWTLANGNDLSVTTSPSGTIVYLESDWNGHSDDPACDLRWVEFGVTTLSDLRKRFGSNGFEFRNRGGSMEVPDGEIMLNSYEVGTVVVTFITKVSAEEYENSKKSGQTWVIADHARLDAISIAEAGYALSEWGDRIYDPDYKKVIWK